MLEERWEKDIAKNDLVWQKWRQGVFQIEAENSRRQVILKEFFDKETRVSLYGWSLLILLSGTVTYRLDMHAQERLICYMIRAAE
jgi:hypothetical protein